jgi:KRAB domain-containing zinc finger protein
MSLRANGVSKMAKNLKAIRLQRDSKKDRKIRLKNPEYGCDLCGLKTSKMYKLRQHLKRHLEPKDECHICHQKFRHVAKHLREVHTSERKFVCNICGLGFKVRSNLKNHVKIHEKPSECPICHKMLSNMARHLKWHKQTKPLPHKCPQCDKMCSTKQAVEQHISRIHEVRPLGKVYTCQTCNLNFIRNRDLRRHAFIHYSGKIFTCEFPNCYEMFKTGPKLQSHKMVHSSDNEPVFACSLCDRKYLRKTALHKHQKNNHSDKT